jgi:hypothetical protein
MMTAEHIQPRACALNRPRSMCIFWLIASKVGMSYLIFRVGQIVLRGRPKEKFNKHETCQSSKGRQDAREVLCDVAMSLLGVRVEETHSGYIIVRI